MLSDLFIRRRLHRARARRRHEILHGRDRVVAPIDGSDRTNLERRFVGRRWGSGHRIQRRNIRIGDRQSGRFRLAHHPLERDVVQAPIRVAAADIGMDAAKPHFAGAVEARRQK